MPRQRQVQIEKDQMRRNKTVISKFLFVPSRLTLARSCTQCINVGFECKTSDKLSRRAFPRGYTESLEERVRALEAEVRELQGLLDEKEEKLELLSRVRAHSPPTLNSASVKTYQSPKSHGSSSTFWNGRESPDHVSDDEESFTIVQSPTMAKTDYGNETGLYMGTSNFRSLMSLSPCSLT
jgi:hypothetical protein